MTAGAAPRRARMSGAQRREQLLDVARLVFAASGFEATSVEEVARRAGVTKPVVYEHFGSKDNLYAAVVERELDELFGAISVSMARPNPREILLAAAEALLARIERVPEGFLLLMRDPPQAFRSRLADIASHVEAILEPRLRTAGSDPHLGALYAHALVGMVAHTGRWWVTSRRPDRKVVAEELVNLAWNGLGHLERGEATVTPLKPV